MKAIKKLRNQLENIGATLDDSDYTLYCDAPEGYVWIANNCTVIAVPYATNSESWLVKAIRKDLLPMLKMGLEKVTDEKRVNEIREALDNPDWGADKNKPEKISF